MLESGTINELGLAAEDVSPAGDKHSGANGQSTSEAVHSSAMRKPARVGQRQAANQTTEAKTGQTQPQTA